MCQLTNAQIAHRLHTTESRVKDAFRHIYRKLDLTHLSTGPRIRRTAAITVAVQNGIVSLSEIIDPEEENDERESESRESRARSQPSYDLRKL
jgi:hypothetical protein